MKTTKLTTETILNLNTESRNFPKFRVGDTIEVSQYIKEGEKERIQKFEGDVIVIHNNGVASTFTVRRIAANGIGVERIFPYFAPFIEGIKLISNGVVRRARLFYLRDRIGSAARVEKKVVTKKARAALAEKASAQV
jgi:large subunit ribosomal protein L19